MTFSGLRRDFRPVLSVAGRPQYHEALIHFKNCVISSTDAFDSLWCWAVCSALVFPEFAIVSLSLVMTSGASSAVVAVVMSSTYAQYSSSVVHPTPCFLISSSNSSMATLRASARHARTLQESISDRGWSAALRSVRPCCWLHSLFACPQVGKDCAQNQAMVPNRLFASLLRTHS